MSIESLNNAVQAAGFAFATSEDLQPRPASAPERAVQAWRARPGISEADCAKSASYWQPAEIRRALAAFIGGLAGRRA